MRHLLVAPIIHHEIYKTYNLDNEADVKENKVNELCEQYKNLIEENDGNEQIFINEVVKQYGNILATDQSETE